MKPTFILSFLLCVTTLAAACTPSTPGAKKSATGNDARQAADSTRKRKNLCNRAFIAQSYELIITFVIYVRLCCISPEISS